MTPTPVEQAKQLLDLVGTPSALVTGTFLAFAARAITDNAVKVDHAKMRFALLASLAAIGVTGSLVLLMGPLAFRALFVYRGGVEATLVVYWMIFLSAVGTLGYSFLVTARCLRELRRPSV